MDGLIEVRLNKWYPIVKYPVEMAAECLVTCERCTREHLVTWAPIRIGTRSFLGFTLGSYDDAMKSDSEFRARSEFTRFKIRKFLPDIVIDPKMPLLDVGMYLVPEEAELWWA